MTLKADVLMITVNRYETQALHTAFERKIGQIPAETPINGRLYFDLGVLNGTRVFHAVAEMGAGGVGATQQAVDKGIRALEPDAVIAVGIAFGINKSRQKIGDILLSRQIRPYDLQRIGKDGKGVLRDDKPHASARLVNFFESIAQTSWRGAEVRPGVLLTGDKLVDNLDFLNQFAKFEPEAIGGEMEGRGLYVACQDHKVDWIVIKAICDWADGEKSKNKEYRQTKAAANATEFLVHCLSQSPLRLQPISGLSISERLREGTWQNSNPVTGLQDHFSDSRATIQPQVETPPTAIVAGENYFSAEMNKRIFDGWDHHTVGDAVALFSHRGHGWNITNENSNLDGISIDFPTPSDPRLLLNETQATDQSLREDVDRLLSNLKYCTNAAATSLRSQLELSMRHYTGRSVFYKLGICEIFHGNPMADEPVRLSLVPIPHWVEQSFNRRLIYLDKTSKNKGRGFHENEEGRLRQLRESGLQKLFRSYGLHRFPFRSSEDRYPAISVAAGGRKSVVDVAA